MTSLQGQSDILFASDTLVGIPLWVMVKCMLLAISVSREMACCYGRHKQITWVQLIVDIHARPLHPSGESVHNFILPSQRRGKQRVRTIANDQTSLVKRIANVLAGLHMFGSVRLQIPFAAISTSRDRNRERVCSLFRVGMREPQTYLQASSACLGSLVGGPVHKTS